MTHTDTGHSQKIHKCKWVFQMHRGGCRTRGTAHQQARWFMRGRVGAALIPGKHLKVDLLILR